MIALLQLSAALYLAAGIAGGVGIALAVGSGTRLGVILLAGGVAAHAAAFVALHGADPVPPLTELPMAVSLMAWMLALVFLVLSRRGRLAGLVVAVGPLAFLGAFGSALLLPHEPSQDLMGAGGWPHAHVLLASGGLALLGVAAVAGLVFLAENRRLKRKRIVPDARLPSLEALDRVNRLALLVGFPLLTLGVLTGMLWVRGIDGRLWTGSAHETWNVLAWGIYAVLVAARFAAHQGARDAAASAVAGFVFLLFAVVGVGIIA